MWTLIRILALAVVLTVVVPMVAPNSSVGQIFGAVMDDVLGFCDRQPQACQATAQLVDAGQAFLSSRLEGLREDGQTLTQEDRVLQPGGGSSVPLDPVQGLIVGGHDGRALEKP